MMSLATKRPEDVVERHQKFGDLAVLDQLLDHARGDLFTRLADHLARACIDQIEGRAGAPDTFREEPRDPAFAFDQLVVDLVVVGIHDAFLVEAKRIEQRRHRQLAAAVDARKHDVLGVEFEVQPRPAVGNDPAGEQQLARSHASCPCHGRRTRRGERCIWDTITRSVPFTMNVPFGVIRGMSPM